MAATITNELIYEILKKLQADISEMKAVQTDHSHQFIRIREEINGLRGDDLRRETLQARMEVRLERIENRLSLNDSTH